MYISQIVGIIIAKRSKKVILLFENKKLLQLSFFELPLFNMKQFQIGILIHIL